MAVLRLLLVLLPVTLYVAWLIYVKRNAARLSDAELKKVRRRFIVTGLISAGLIMVGIIIFAILEPSNTSGTYVPPRTENGRIIPGHVESDE